MKCSCTLWCVPIVPAPQGVEVEGLLEPRSLKSVWAMGWGNLDGEVGELGEKGMGVDREREIEYAWSSVTVHSSVVMICHKFTTQPEAIAVAGAGRRLLLKPLHFPMGIIEVIVADNQFWVNLLTLRNYLCHLSLHYKTGIPYSRHLILIL